MVLRASVISASVTAALMVLGRGAETSPASQDVAPLANRVVLASEVHSAPSVLSGPYVATVLSAHDGDSLKTRVTVWPGQIIEATIRLRDVDTPELNASCAAEKNRAKQARDFVRVRAVGQEVRLHAISKGKYFGRVIAHVSLPTGEDLGQLLLSRGLGRPYGGGRRIDGCDVAQSG